MALSKEPIFLLGKVYSPVSTAGRTKGLMLVLRFSLCKLNFFPRKSTAKKKEKMEGA